MPKPDLAQAGKHALNIRRWRKIIVALCVNYHKRKCKQQKNKRGKLMLNLLYLFWDNRLATITTKRTCFTEIKILTKKGKSKR